MEHPQTLAINLADNIKNIGDFACCAFCTIWFCDLNPSDADAIKIVNDAVNDKVIDKECTVYWNKFIEYLTGRSVSVEFRAISSLEEIKDLPGKILVHYKNGNSGHWVGVEKGKITFNPLEFSKTVALGKPDTCRIITVKMVE